MKNFINRIKWKLLNWLLEDICQGCEHCEHCCMGVEDEHYRDLFECMGDDVRAQAKKTWEVEQ